MYHVPQKMSTKKKIELVVLILLIIWGILFIINYLRYTDAKKPILAIHLTHKYDDGVVEEYVSLGYVYRAYKRNSITKQEMVPFWVLMENPNRKPQNYWKDTSHNNIIRNFIGNPNVQVNEKFELLLSGDSVAVHIKDDLTYDFEHSTEDNFWSILYLTGYLTKIQNDTENGMTHLIIPNEEVKTIFADTIVEWFKDTMRNSNRTSLMDSLWLGKEETASVIISKILRQTISYHNYKEDYYHAFLAGIFVGIGYLVESDREHGEGRPDIVVKDIVNQRVIIMEAKHSQNVNNMQTDCLKAVNQIAVKKYIEDFLDDYDTVVCYGISFFRKRCLVKRIDLTREGVEEYKK